MAILEAGMIYEGILLVSQQYYNSELQFDDKLRSGLLSAISAFAKEAFRDNIESFTLSRYEISCAGRSIQVPGNQMESNILAYAMMEKDTNKKVVKSNLIKVLDAFLNRYPVGDIVSGEVERFEPFKERMDQIFADLRFKTEDRFKNIF